LMVWFCMVRCGNRRIRSPRLKHFERRQYELADVYVSDD
jgi:hypothetical protein